MRPHETNQTVSLGSSVNRGKLYLGRAKLYSDLQPRQPNFAWASLIRVRCLL